MFFLAAGQIKTEPTYWFYETQTDGSSFLMNIPTKRVLVYEIPGLTQPHVEYKEGRLKFYPDSQCKVERKDHPELDHIEQVEYEKDGWFAVYVPTGTVAYLLNGEQPK